MKYILNMLSLAIAAFLFSCSRESKSPDVSRQPVYQDVPYLQDYAVKYLIEDQDIELKKVFTDRNDVVQVLTTKGLYRPNNGHFQYPGTLEKDITYIPMADKKVADMLVYQNQFVYVNDQAVFSNAWAGKLFSIHNIPSASKVCAGDDFTFLISDGKKLSLIHDSEMVWQGSLPEKAIISMKYNSATKLYYILSENSLYTFSTSGNKLNKLYSGMDFTCFEISKTNNSLLIGTNDGYIALDASGKPKGEINKKLPWTELTSIAEIDGKIWFGSTKGAFMLKDDGKFNYYFGQRWLPGDVVKHISSGPENSISILTDKGLGQIHFKEMTLEDKAMVFEKQVRQRQIRYGINSNVTSLQNHDLSTAQNRVADSDNLWTGMYLGSQLFRYLATGSEEAKQNCYESFEAMERMHEINGIQGLFGRSFERRGYQDFHKEYRSYVDNYWYEGYQGTISWRHAEDPEWD